MSDLSRPFGRFVMRGLWFPIVLALAVGGFVARSGMEQPATYVSLARLVAEMPNGAVSSENSSENFYGTIMETLEGSQLHKHALQRVGVLFPEMKQAEVEVRVSRNKGSSMINVAVVGAEREYSRVFLNALLDEFKAYNEMNREQHRNKAVQALAEDVATSQAAVKTAADKLAAFNKTDNITLLKIQNEEQADALKSLFSERRRLRATQGSDESAAKDLSVAKTPPVPPTDPKKYNQYLTEMREYEMELATQKTGTLDKPDVAVRLVALDEKVRDLEKEVIESSARLSAYQWLQKEADDAASLQKELFNLMHKFTVAEDSRTDSIDIMERASPSVEDVRGVLIPSVVRGGVAFLCGMALLLICGALWTGFTSRHALPPRLPPELT